MKTPATVLHPLFLLLGMLLFLASSGRAGVLTGTLQDSLSGKGIADAQLICLGTSSGERRLARTDIGGVFTFKDLPAGSYWLAAAHGAYFSKRLENIAVPANGTVRHTLQLVQKPLGMPDAVPVAPADAALVKPEPKAQPLNRPDPRTKRKESKQPLRDWDDLKLRVYGWLLEKVGGEPTNER